MTRSLSVVVLGIGHVGLVTVATLASLGHQVVGFDVNPDVIEQVNAGDIHFYEPGLADLIQEGVQAGHLRFSSDPADAIAGADIAMICVGTPSEPAMNGEDGLDLSMVKAAALTVITHTTQPIVIVEKSTVPPGTGDRIEDLVALHGKSDLITVASNPEFLREGQAVADTLRPDRIVVGANDEHTHQVLAALYAPQLASHPSAWVATDRVTAEITKQASNAFLALKISFINEVAALCEHVGADVTTVADGMGHDPRIGRAFLNAGIGYGGSCFPKDVSGLSAVYEMHHLPETTISGAHWVNEEAKQWPVKTLAKALWSVKDATIAVLGASFKPHTDDIRESVAMYVVEQLLAQGAHVRLTDPVALPRVQADTLLCEYGVIDDHAIAGAIRFDDYDQDAEEDSNLGFLEQHVHQGNEQGRLELVDTPQAAIEGADAVLLATEWPEYAALNPADIAQWLRTPVVVDGRIQWDGAAFEDAGLRFYLGRRGRN